MLKTYLQATILFTLNVGIVLGAHHLLRAFGQSYDIPIGLALIALFLVCVEQAKRR